ncbi:ADP-ribose pyrophosphatase [Gracilariopsis chorda]|uniref:ADP-ribose pyrophosphatase n=1 Tax=Gracilariopsis chorda TaxID=448386 RepID=A0A2V3IPN4_9FLOR|nr:ADP-ribose pyrophosphatase [Gracilariopsis chorda]|eukprot:PXF43090.1 ADP-ribose pyrophosphatase [Gracilariopsis chorda]
MRHSSMQALPSVDESFGFVPNSMTKPFFCGVPRLSVFMPSRSIGPLCGTVLDSQSRAGRPVRTLMESKTPNMRYESLSVAVSMALFRNNRFHSEILLVRRGNEPNKGLWSLPGGRVRDEEDLRCAALRELLEETGIMSHQCHLLSQPIDIALVPSDKPLYHIYVFAGVCDPQLEPIAGDDARDARFSRTDALSKLTLVNGLESRVLKALSAILDDARTAMKFHGSNI